MTMGAPMASEPAGFVIRQAAAMRLRVVSNEV
jgi:hypothetical protein